MAKRSYSAKAASKGRDIGKKGKAFGQIAEKAGKKYGSQRSDRSGAVSSPRVRRLSPIEAAIRRTLGVLTLQSDASATDIYILPARGGAALWQPRRDRGGTVDYTW